ncbi:MAG TPA: hypothetical protein VHM94_11875 [Acidimicrobiia bacterium]|jgi:hypothetical protein|nr:hypothetical protein [Acidimicrobiia bacterium]
MIIGAFVLMAVVGLVAGLIGLATRDESPTHELPRDCPRLESLEPGQTVGCIQLPLPTGH